MLSFEDTDEAILSNFHRQDNEGEYCTIGKEGQHEQEHT